MIFYYFLKQKNTQSLKIYTLELSVKEILNRKAKIEQDFYRSVCQKIKFVWQTEPNIYIYKKKIKVKAY